MFYPRRFTHWLPLFRFYQRAFTSTKKLVVLGIETSCDDTACAVVTSDGEILANCRRSQHLIHEKSGGIVPNLAMHSHTAQLPGLLTETLGMAGMGITEMDYIAVTRGPGLPGCLAVGLNAAKSLAAVHQIPLLGIHHMMGHALMARLTSKPRPEFPFLGLLISGGHTMVVLSKNANTHEIMANTLDDAVGEGEGRIAFDKVTRSLGIPWHPQLGPGAALEQLALTCPDARGDISLPVPLSKSTWRKERAFSFSGLKSAVQRLALTGAEKSAIARAFHQVVCLHLEDKLNLCISKCQDMGLKALVVSGGVASNSIIRERLDELAKKHELPLHVPPKELCTDNAVMIAWAGLERIRIGLLADPYDIDVKPIWPINEV